jgi:hypothetical protein
MDDRIASLENEGTDLAHDHGRFGKDRLADPVGGWRLVLR